MFRGPTRRSLRLANIPPAPDTSLDDKSNLHEIVKDDVYYDKSHTFNTGIIFIENFNILLVII